MRQRLGGNDQGVSGEVREGIYLFLLMRFDS